MRKDREYKIQKVLCPSGDILYAEDDWPAGRGPKGSCKHIAAFCFALEELSDLVLHGPSGLLRHACKRGISHEK